VNTTNRPNSNSYEHPGHLFLSRYGLPKSKSDVVAYAQFLLEESGFEDELPIKLSRIYERFRIPEPLRVPLLEQQGILVDSSTGVIVINENDPAMRQRFTEAHELIELLFAAVEEQNSAHLIPCHMWEKKEQFCDYGAAELLMPGLRFCSWLQELGISINTAQVLTTLYETSFLATLIRMVQMSHTDCALVLWRCGFKPSQLKKVSDAPLKCEPKLRISWASQSESWCGGYLPPHKSIPHQSIVGCAYVTGERFQGAEVISLGARSIYCQVEATPLKLGDESCVISLLHL